ncbi:MAG: ABC transporter ATP-binding protein [Xanthomonadales bacterium]|nr:ABC transporter ATP-binding protein [Gammaproteobacteria bacterium]MBT8074334.1 ABC transporter ATP-binding protein [Gammaproteobacteria bacterium]NNK05187.1 ABC transporter ATP-binding protein [Xanthomonadales bacterium]NNK97584.1 ABC transporter ATP-binding protein [Xanthomonadales bacterium]
MGGEVIHALRDVSLSITRGEYVAVMGPSGSGKSTLMNLIGALDVPTRGDLVIDGLNLSQQEPDTLADFRNHTIGFVFQQFNLLPKTSALENVKLPLFYSRKHNGGDANELAIACLERVGLADRLDHETTQLSGGQQQRVAIARALVNNPSVILADEPTGALDTKTSLELLDLFRELNQSGITVIVVTHDQEVADESRRNLFFRDGQIVSDERLTPRRDA